MPDYQNPFRWKNRGLKGLGAPGHRRHAPPPTSDSLQMKAGDRPWQANSAPAAYPAAGASASLLTYTVPPGSVLVVTGISIVNIGGAVVDFQGAIVFHVLRNSAGAVGFENLYGQVGTLSNPQATNLTFAAREILQVTVSIPANQLPPSADNSPAVRLIGYLKYAPRRNNLLRTA